MLQKYKAKLYLFTRTAARRFKHWVHAEWALWLLVLLVLVAMSTGCYWFLTGKPSHKTNSGKRQQAITTQPHKTAKHTTAPAQTPTPLAWWHPGTGSLPWQWELNHHINLSNAKDAGMGSRTYSGQAAAQPTVYDIDGFNNTADDIAAIHKIGAKAICYIEVGAAENYRSDYASFPSSALGNSIQDYPDERYLDINNPKVAEIIKARIAMCHSKGFDAIEPDIDDSYTDNTGFTITETNEAQYLGALAGYAHSLGMAWGLKNGGDGGTPATFISDMLPSIDFAVVEEPYYLHTISYFHPVLYNAGKALFVAEYTTDTSNAATFCPQALSDHANAALLDVSLDASIRIACQ